MVKEPKCGRVKSRLARDIGAARATSFFRTNMRLTALRLKYPARWQTILACAPDASTGERCFDLGFERIAQGPGGLGARLARVADLVGAGPLVIIGADIPGIGAAAIAEAFRALRGADAVVGPSRDGGYWLIGLNRRMRHRNVFEGVRWSSAFARADTLQNLRGQKVVEIRALDDVDCKDDYLRLGRAIGRLVT